MIRNRISSLICNIFLKKDTFTTYKNFYNLQFSLYYDKIFLFQYLLFTKEKYMYINVNVLILERTSVVHYSCPNSSIIFLLDY